MTKKLDLLQEMLTDATRLVQLLEERRFYAAFYVATFLLQEITVLESILKEEDLPK